MTKKSAPGVAKAVQDFKFFEVKEAPSSLNDIRDVYKRILVDVEEKVGMTIPRFVWNTDDAEYLIDCWEKYTNTLKTVDMYSHPFHRFWLDKMIEWQSAMLWNEIRNYLYRTYLNAGDKKAETTATNLADAASLEFEKSFM